MRGAVIADLLLTRDDQERRYPVQSIPHGTHKAYETWAKAARKSNEAAVEAGTITWRDVLEEEFAEVSAEVDVDKLRVELLQVAAIAVRWVEAIDREKN